MVYNNLINFIILVLVFVIPLMVTALGGMFSERSGVTNIALEGLMIIGAFVGIVVVNIFVPFFTNSPQLLYIIGMIAAGIAGLLFSFLHAIASVKMSADQTISATAINILTPALALFLTMSLGLGEARGSDKLFVPGSMFRISEVPILSKIPFFGDILFTNVYLGLYFGILILIISYIVLYKTRFGLRLRSCGENPHAADSAGINIYSTRYAGIFISGVLASWGGYFLILSSTVEFDATVSGFGFLALAVLIFGNWKPVRIAITAILFSALRTLSEGVAFFPFLEALGINKYLLSMLPYIGTLIVLVLTSKKSAAPKAVGKIYNQADR